MGNPAKISKHWAVLLVLHTFIFWLGYWIALQLLWGLTTLLVKAGTNVNLVTLWTNHGLWAACGAGFASGLIGVKGIEAVFGRIQSTSVLRQPPVAVSLIFSAWFCFGVLRWALQIHAQESVLASPQWSTGFIDTFFLDDCPSGWLIHQFNLNSCENQLAYTTLFVASLGYAASYLVKRIAALRVSPAALTSTDTSADV